MQRDSETGQFVGENDYSRSELLSLLRRYEMEEGEVIRDDIVSHPDYPNRTDFESEFGTFSEAKRAAGLRNPGRYYLTESELEAVDSNLRSSNRTRELTYGLLMGDGTIPRAENKNNCLRVKMISRPFLSWLADEYGRATRTVRLDSTAEESAAQIRKPDSGLMRRQRIITISTSSRRDASPTSRNSVMSGTPTVRNSSRIIST